MKGKDYCETIISLKTALQADDFIKSLDAAKKGGSIKTGDKCAITQNN